MKKSFKFSSIIIFIVTALFYAIGNFVWWKTNTPIIPQGICALHFLDIFQDGWLYSNAPLLTWIMKGIFFLFGKEYFDLEIITVNYFFFLTALYFIYKIGVELKDKETGNIAMILFGLTPAVYGLSRQYGHQDWHVMVAMVANIYCLMKLNFFENRKWSILYGITVGLGLLIKDEFLPYFFTPWLYVVIKSLAEKIEIKKVINILITIAVGSLIAGCHYFNSGIINKILNEPIREPVNIFACENIKMLTLGLSSELLSPIIFLLFLSGFVWFVVKFNNKHKWCILLWITVPWLIIMFMPHHKEPEYCIGFVPAIILIIALFFSGIKNKISKIVMLLILILVLLLQFFDLSYKKIFLLDNLCFYNRYNLMFYEKDDTSRFVELIEKLKPFKDKNIFVYNTDDFIMQHHTLLAFMALNDLTVCSDISQADIVVNNGKEKSLEELANTDFILSSIVYLADNNTKDNFTNRKKEEHKKLRDVLSDKFYPYKSWYLQNIEDDAHLVRLYKKK